MSDSMPEEIIATIENIVPPSLADAYSALLLLPTKPESEQMADMLATMLRQIPAILGMTDPALFKLLDAILPSMTLTIRMAEPEIIREGICATVGTMLRQCAEHDISFDEIQRFMLNPPDLPTNE